MIMIGLKNSDWPREVQVILANDRAMNFKLQNYV